MLHLLTLQFLLLATLIALVLGIPIKFAADFTGATRSSYGYCVLATLLASVLAVVVFRMLSGGFDGFIAACTVCLLTYVSVLRVPASAIIGFAVLAVGVQLATALAVVSLGYNILKTGVH